MIMLRALVARPAAPFIPIYDYLTNSCPYH
jgi:hypothetical protein